MIQRAFCFLLFASAFAIHIDPSLGQSPPSFNKQIQPFFKKYCSECHNAKRARAGLNLESFEGLQKGSENGPVLIPGKADQSLLVQLLEKKKEPHMPPPEKPNQPKPNEVQLVREWVSAGAKFDAAATTVVLPKITPRTVRPAPIATLAYLPNSTVLAVAQYRDLVFIDAKQGAILQRLSSLPCKVTALAASPEGKLLATAFGLPGTPNSLRIYQYLHDAKQWMESKEIKNAHDDVIQDIAFSPDGNHMLTAGYDKRVKLWDVREAELEKIFKEHSDSVYGAAFSPDGRFFATCGADRAVKVFDAKSAKLLYTLGEATDWVYALAFSPDSKHIAAAGVDKSIRVWKVDPNEGAIVHSVFAHQSPIIALEYATDGKTLYSMSEDRLVKAWDAAKMAEQNVFPPQPENPLALAVAHDGKQLAVGRYDGALVLLDAKTGKIQSQPLPEKPRPPVLTSITPNFGQRGRTVEIKLEGKSLNDAIIIESDVRGLQATLKQKHASGTLANAVLEIPLETKPGIYKLWVKNDVGKSEQIALMIDAFHIANEKRGHNSPGQAQLINVPVTMVGVVEKAGDMDWYRFDAKPGDQIGVLAQATPHNGKPQMQPYLQLVDAKGNVLADSTTSPDGAFLGYRVEKPGTYAIGIRDREFEGNPQARYRLHIGELPVVNSVFPLGLQRGTETGVTIYGVNLAAESMKIKADANAALGTRIPVNAPAQGGTPLGNKQMVVGEFPEVIEGNGTSADIPVPGTANGRIAQPGETDQWRFHAKKGQQLILEVEARRLGSDLDSFIEVLDRDGNPVPRATLRSMANTYVTFRDHNSSQPNIRIEAWSELAMDDYIYVGNQLLKIRELPTHPDADCIFYSQGGRRIGYLDTTPTHLSKGDPMYKVSIHPPGTTFPPNGFPVITIYYRNDDGGAGFNRDSRLTFDPPADGEYIVRIGDARSTGGVNYAYRLTVRPPRPSYEVSFSPNNPSVWKGGSIPVTVTAKRIDGFDGPIDVRLENLPMGFSAPPTTILGGQESTVFALWADADAKTPEKAPPLKLVAQAQINGTMVQKTFTGGQAKAVEPGDIVTTTKESEITIKPGEITRLTVTINRRNNFKGRVPIDVSGLPHGVKVLDIGLNGILITENETTRTMRIYCYPWVQPMEHPIAVSAVKESDNTRHGARSVLLKIAGK